MKRTIYDFPMKLAKKPRKLINTSDCEDQDTIEVCWRHPKCTGPSGKATLEYVSKAIEMSELFINYFTSGNLLKEIL